VIFKILIFVILGLILLSLASGVFFLANDTDDQERLIKALTVRVSLSILLITVIVVGFYTGQLKTRDMTPRAVMELSNSPTQPAH